MVRKSFKVTVNGETFHVEVEEVKTGKDIIKARPENAHSGRPLPVKKEAEAAPVPAADKKEETKPKSADGEVLDKGTVVVAPMPGSVNDIRVKVGDKVNQDDVLVILEAMKMENEISSPVTGTVTRVLASKGAAVNSKDPLIVIE